MSHQPDIRDKVLEKIRAGEIRMRSKSSFLLKGLLVGVCATLVLAASLFALSFAFFSVKTSGAQYLLLFGTQGVQAFLALFPWASLLLFLLLIVALELIVRRFTSAYRYPVLRLFSLVLFVGLAGSALIEVTPLHSSIFSAAKNTERLPVLGQLYEKIDAPRPEQGLYSGTILSIEGSTITVSDDSELEPDTDLQATAPAPMETMESATATMRMQKARRSWTIVPPADASPETFSVGEKVYVGGREEDGMIRAYGIHSESKRGKNENGHEGKGRGGKSEGKDDREDGELK